MEKLKRRNISTSTHSLQRSSSSSHTSFDDIQRVELAAQKKKEAILNLTYGARDSKWSLKRYSSTDTRTDRRAKSESVVSANMEKIGSREPSQNAQNLKPKPSSEIKKEIKKEDNT